MPQYFYKRNAVPVGGKLKLEIQFRDSAGNPKDASSFPSVMVTDALGSVARSNSSSLVVRTAIGRYRLDYQIPDGYAAGVWSDTWTGTVDGYVHNASFDFTVDPSGTIEATGATVTTPEMRVGDEPVYNWSQEEIKGINILMQMLRMRLRNSQIKPTGEPCDVLNIHEMESFLVLALSEFNATPAITSYIFADVGIYSIFADIIVEGAYLKSLAAIIPLQSATELVITDNGIGITPASVSGALSNIMSTLMSEYRAKVKEAKRNHRSSAIGLGAGSLVSTSPAYRRLRFRKENQIV